MTDQTLAELRASREKLDAEIAAREAEARTSWNEELLDCAMRLEDWLRARKLEFTVRDRRNTEIWNIGHDALTITFARDEGEYHPGLYAISGGTLTLEWQELPEPDRFARICAACLNRPYDTDEEL